MNGIGAKRFDWIPLALLLAIVLGALAMIGAGIAAVWALVGRYLGKKFFLIQRMCRQQEK